MINPWPFAHACAYIDAIFISQSYDISISTSTRRTYLSVFLVLMSTQFSLAYTCACAYAFAYAYALAKTRLTKIVLMSVGKCTLHVSWGEILHFKYPCVSTVNCIAKPDSFFPLNFNVFVGVENRERARERDKKQKRSFLLEEKHESFITAVRKKMRENGRQ